MRVHHEDERVTLWHGDALEVLRELPDASVDAVCTDPPYGLANTDSAHVAETITRWVNGERDYLPGGAGFMGKAWDAFVPPVAVWDECLRVLKPGGHLLAFAGSRTVDLMTLGIRLAGFEVRDSIAWLHSQGFPKSLDVSKAIDKAAGARWQGWGTALKPSHEPVVVARKPLIGTIAQNVLTYGTGALNIDACRITASDQSPERPTSHDSGRQRETTRAGEASADRRYTERGGTNFAPLPGVRGGSPAGRWPTNVVLDDSQAAELDRQSGETASKSGGTSGTHFSAGEPGTPTPDRPRGGHDDQGGASRFFPTFRYEAKAPRSERPRYKREGGSDNATTYGQMKTRECNVCGSRAKAAGGDQSGKPWPTCGHDDWSWVEQQSARDEYVAHPTVKPLALMRWLVRLVTPPGGTVLEPFAGSGTTVEACLAEGFCCIAIEREADYLPLIMQRVNRRRDAVAYIKAAGDDLGLFDLEGEGA